jgi:beta-glucosidase
MGYLARQWPPVSGNPFRAARAFRNVVLAHTFAAMSIRETCPGARIGVSVRARSVAPLDVHSVWDLRTARREEHWHNHAIIEAVQDGRLPFPMRQLGGIDNLFDFIGVGFYGAERVSFSPIRPRSMFVAPVGSDGRPTATPCPEPSPCELGRILGEMDRYGKPVLVTGNGLATDNDDARTRFLLDHLATVSDRISAGSDLKGFFHYSLLDGFEWSEGCSARHGLVHVDWATLARTPNQSAYLYKDICEHDALRPGTLARYCPDWREPGKK